MKHTLLIIVLAVLSCCPCALHAQSPTVKAPKLIVDTVNTELGEIYSGLVKHFSVEIKNGGNDTLKIVSIKPSCGCTTVKAPKSILLPGESDTVSLDFNTTGMRGRVVKNVDIESNDPNTSHKTISFLSTVLTDFEILRYGPSVFLGNVPVGKAIKEVLTLQNVAKYPIKIMGITSSSPKISVTTKTKTIRQLDSTKIQVSLVPEQEGLTTYELVMKTNSKNMSSFPIKVMVVGIKPKS
jgi:hypothetical protein